MNPAQEALAKYLEARQGVDPIAENVLLGNCVLSMGKWLNAADLREIMRAVEVPNIVGGGTISMMCQLRRHLWRRRLDALAAAKVEDASAANPAACSTGDTRCRTDCGTQRRPRIGHGKAGGTERG